MTLQDFGAIGSIIGALSVVATLIYLSKQVRLNTQAMDEGRKLALAQTYQMRSTALQTMLVHAADSKYIAPVIIKLTELGYWTASIRMAGQAPCPCEDCVLRPEAHCKSH